MKTLDHPGWFCPLTHFTSTLTTMHTFYFILILIYTYMPVRETQVIIISTLFCVYFTGCYDSFFFLLPKVIQAMKITSGMIKETICLSAVLSYTHQVLCLTPDSPLLLHHVIHDVPHFATFLQSVPVINNDKKKNNLFSSYHVQLSNSPEKTSRKRH